jgi:ligand-binding sensor domain-containing protein
MSFMLIQFQNDEFHAVTQPRTNSVTTSNVIYNDKAGRLWVLMKNRKSRLMFSSDEDYEC